MLDEFVMVIWDNAVPIGFAAKITDHDVPACYAFPFIAVRPKLKLVPAPEAVADVRGFLHDAREGAQNVVRSCLRSKWNIREPNAAPRVGNLCLCQGIDEGCGNWTWICARSDDQSVKRLRDINAGDAFCNR